MSKRALLATSALLLGTLATAVPLGAAASADTSSGTLMSGQTIMMCSNTDLRCQDQSAGKTATLALMMVPPGAQTEGQAITNSQVASVTTDTNGNFAVPLTYADSGFAASANNGWGNIELLAVEDAGSYSTLTLYNIGRDAVSAQGSTPASWEGYDGTNTAASLGLDPYITEGTGANVAEAGSKLIPMERQDTAGKLQVLHSTRLTAHDAQLAIAAINARSKATSAAAHAPAPLSSPKGPVPPMCGSKAISAPTEREAALGEMHVGYDANGTLTYTRAADTTIEVALQADAGGSFSADGSASVNNTTTDTVGVSGGRGFANAIDSAFNFQEFELTGGFGCPHGNEWRVVSWAGGEITGPNVQQYDNHCASKSVPTGNTVPFGANSFYIKSQATGYTYAAGVSLPGVNLSTTSVYNQSNDTHWTFGSGTSLHELCGNNGAPNAAAIVYTNDNA